jgi:hypothetical protein
MEVTPTNFAAADCDKLKAADFSSQTGRCDVLASG